MPGFDSPAQATYWFVQGRILFSILYLLGIGCFVYIAAKRLAPLYRAQADSRFDRPWLRLARVAQFWFAQWRHPRYPSVGALHIAIFAGFLVLVIRAFFLLSLGISGETASGDTPGIIARIYGVARDYAITVVFLAVTA
ncbi:MAG TPA: electron transfer flavoprotein, partial [Bryobacteraceae bacterium]